MRDVGSIMPDPVALAGPMPKTLATAKIEIARLREKLGFGLSDGPKGNKGPSCPVGLIRSSPVPAGGSKPIPPDTSDPQPNPDRGVGPPELSSMTPAAFESFIQRCGNKELSILLGRETAKGRKQDSSVVSRLYKEIKKRGA